MIENLLLGAGVLAPTWFAYLSAESSKRKFQIFFIGCVGLGAVFLGGEIKSKRQIESTRNQNFIMYLNQTLKTSYDKLSREFAHYKVQMENTPRFYYVKPDEFVRLANDYSDALADYKHIAQIAEMLAPEKLSENIKSHRDDIRKVANVGLEEAIKKNGMVYSKEHFDDVANHIAAAADSLKGLMERGNRRPIPRVAK